MLNTSQFYNSKNHKTNYRIQINNDFSRENVSFVRLSVSDCLNSDLDKVYLDTQNVEFIDLVAINEIVNSHYLLENNNQQLVLVYKKESLVEKWICLTGIDRFILTAMIPNK